jgi:hypothetical protein
LSIELTNELLVYSYCLHFVLTRQEVLGLFNLLKCEGDGYVLYDLCVVGITNDKVVSRGEHEVFCNQEACGEYMGRKLIGTALFFYRFDLADGVEGKLRVLINLELSPAIGSFEESFITKYVMPLGLFVVHLTN